MRLDSILARRTVIATVVLALVTFAAPSFIGAAATAAQTDAQIAVALQALQRYDSSGSLSDLTSAVSTMDGTVNLDALTPQNFVTRRRALVQAWAQILKSIEQSYDPTYNPNDPSNIPQPCVTPPPDANGARLPGCSNPNAIQDPSARAKYLAAIEANKQVTQRWNHYWGLVKLDLRAMRVLQMSLQLLQSVAPDSEGADFSALDAIVQQAGISHARRAKIDGFFYQNP
ncbi:MAG: hypothetical protein WBD74_08770 [Candidatus Aquilonibacter sp.]